MIDETPAKLKAGRLEMIMLGLAPFLTAIAAIGACILASAIAGA